MASVLDMPHQVWSNRLQPPTVYVKPVWEYKHVVRSVVSGGPLGEAELNAFGGEGWEMAAAFVEHGRLHVYFKRVVS